MKNIPITLEFDQTRLVGNAKMNPVEFFNAEFFNNHTLAPGYKVMPDGKIELIELSWIPTAHIKAEAYKQGQVDMREIMESKDE